MVLKEGILLFIGLCAGGVVAGGVYAFLVIVGVFVRLVEKTGTRNYVLLYQAVTAAGGIGGNLLDLYEFPIPMGKWAGSLFLGAAGLSTGVFVGCLVMSLAETLKAIPVIGRRIRLSAGIPWMILSIAAGKLVGSLLYMIRGMSG